MRQGVTDTDGLCNDRIQIGFQCFQALHDSTKAIIHGTQAIGHCTQARKCCIQAG